MSMLKIISTSKLIQIHLTRYRNHRFYSGPTPGRLTGRNYVVPKDLDQDDVKSILYTAIDLKCLLKNSRFSSNYTRNKKITLLIDEPCVIIQSSVMSAATAMRSNLNVIVDPKWETTKNVKTIANVLSSCSDLIFSKSKYQSKLKDIAKYAKIPVVCISSCKFSMIESLAGLMSLQEKYGHLKGLTLGWIGEACPLINTYLLTALNQGINIKYYCACPRGSKMSPAMLPVAEKISRQNQTSIVECDSMGNVLEEVDVIVLPETGLEYARNLLKLQDIDEKANKNWYLLHGWTVEYVDLVDPQHSLIWQCKDNLQWIFAAMILQFLTKYEHCSPMPKFEGSNADNTP